MGLDDKFAAVHGQILLMEPLTPIIKVFSLIFQEEQQKGYLQSTQSSDALLSMGVPTLSTTNRATTKRKSSYVNIVESKVTQ